MIPRLLLGLALISFSFTGFAQRLPAHTALIPNQLTAQRSRFLPPAAQETQRSVAGFMQAQARGPYSMIYRSAFWDQAAWSWQGDSTWLHLGYDILPVMGVRGLKLMGTIGYNYTTLGDSIKTEFWPDGGTTNRDTLSRTWNYTGGLWTMTSRTRWRYLPNLYEMTAEYPGVLGQLEVSALERLYTRRDALNREFSHVDSSWNAFMGWRFTIDSTWYHGATDSPARIHQYMRNDSGGAYLAIVQDSIRHDANGEFLYMAEYDYDQDNALLAYDRQARSHSGDTVTVSSDRITYSQVTGPARFYIRETTIDRGDSVVNLTYMVQSDGHQVIKRAVTHYSLPPNYPRNWDYVYRQETYDSAAAVWRVSDRSRSIADIGLGGEPHRIMFFSYDFGGDSLVPSYKQDFEAYSPELLSKKGNASAKRLAISPNPASGIITLSGAAGADRLVLTTALGQQHRLPLKETKADVSSLAKGIYQAAIYRQGMLLGTARFAKE